MSSSHANPNLFKKVEQNTKQDIEIYRKRITDLHDSTSVLDYLSSLEETFGVYCRPDQAGTSSGSGDDVIRSFATMTYNEIIDACIESVLGPGAQTQILKMSEADLFEATKARKGEVILFFHKIRQVESLWKNPEIMQRVHNLVSLCTYAEKLIHSAHRVRFIAMEAAVPVLVDPKMFSPIQGLPAPDLSALEPDSEGTNPFQSLLLFLLNKAQELGLYKLGNDCYRQILTKNGMKTYAWSVLYSIKDFVYHMTSKEEYPEQWKNLTHGKGNATAAIEYLTCCQDIQFPTLVRDRYVLAFQNGLYFTEHDRFWPYNSTLDMPKGVIAACKYFDLPFSDYNDIHDWYDIPTPNLQKILSFQEFTSDVCRWMYIFLGRLLYEINHKDSWQVIPFCKGQASSGKSTILLKVAKNFFEKVDVGVLSNNIEKKFGISAFFDKFLFVAPEIKADLQLEQAEFQSIVSGEDVQVNIKHQKAQSIQWTVPGILAGNEVPNWSDNSGSITRRVVIWDFMKMVENGEMDLGHKLELEMPAIIVKCNRAYLEAVSKVGKDNIWTHLPNYFHVQRQELAASTNALVSFLQSDQLVTSPDLFMPYEEFRVLFNDFCMTNGIPRKKLQKETYTYPFRQHKIMVEESGNRMYHGKPFSGKILVGVDVKKVSDTGTGMHNFDGF